MTADAPSLSMEYLSRLQPISALKPQQLEPLVETCRRLEWRRGEPGLAPHLISGHAVYLLKGELKLDFPDGTFQVMVGGREKALHPLPCTGLGSISAKPITDVELMLIDAEKLDLALTWDQLADSPKPHGASEAFSTLAIAYSAFSALPPAHIDALLQCFERQSVKRGEIVVSEGEVGDFFYLIESGRCTVTRTIGGTVLTIAELKTGDAFGEDALVSDSTRNATVTMKTAGALLRLKKQDFVELLREPLLQRLTWDEARQRISAGAQWIDARFTAEFQHDGLGGAVNIPVNEIRQAAPLLDAKKDYIVYCQTGRRSSAAAFILSQHGLHAFVLEGGLRARPAEVKHS